MVSSGGAVILSFCVVLDDRKTKKVHESAFYISSFLLDTLDENKHGAGIARMEWEFLVCVESLNAKRRNMMSP